MWHYEFEIICSENTLRKFLSITNPEIKWNKSENEYNTHYYEMHEIINKTIEKYNYKYNDEKFKNNNEIYKCGDIINVSYITYSQSKNIYYTDFIGKIIFIDKNENNLFVLCNDNYIRSLLKEGCCYDFQNGAKYDISITKIYSNV